MRKLKKFENWIDDEVADTDRRMSELDNEEGINEPVEDKGNLEQLKSDINLLVNNFIEKNDHLKIGSVQSALRILYGL